MWVNGSEEFSMASVKLYSLMALAKKGILKTIFTLVLFQSHNTRNRSNKELHLRK